MRRIAVTTTAVALVTERWLLDVPDDFDAIGDELLDVLDHPEDFGAGIYDVHDTDLDHEHDREVISWEEVSA